MQRGKYHCDYFVESWIRRHTLQRDFQKPVKPNSSLSFDWNELFL